MHEAPKDLELFAYLFDLPKDKRLTLASVPP